jgi:hypothetical protein
MDMQGPTGLLGKMGRIPKYGRPCGSQDLVRRDRFAFGRV